ncbi:hypothetical protein QAO71_12125 [Halopseudomonas sp. SMJS2]|uniref:hypothetical protein n=1 Tax=Halopseudomonas sp. SMJS2 TaxID=3041098 RepID=UPI000449AB66|nr:hypothetical protein [Halopseudomonas sp. SMJS2]EZQ19045.1 hypothetical protein CF98_00745 [Halopseudomonas bauzanensis]WGK60815.1 hypothetical protein QAO71_12125 [Halopseudomonas sp. SMJS2]
MKGTSNSAMQIWRWPVLFGTVSAAGLIVALLGDGWYDVLSCLALGLVAAAGIWLGAVARAEP